MPTSYTAKLYDGDNQTFEEFVLSCAHAFIIEIKDSSLNSPLPEVTYNPDNHYAKTALQGRARLKELQAMTPEEAAAAAREAHEDSVESWQKHAIKMIELENRYRAMLDEVHVWVPPSEKHLPLKEFMIEQLETSIKHDCVFSWDRPRLLTGYEWLRKEKERARIDISFGEERDQKEKERAKNNKLWILQLHESLEVTA